MCKMIKANFPEFISRPGDEKIMKEIFTKLKIPMVSAELYHVSADSCVIGSGEAMQGDFPAAGGEP